MNDFRTPFESDIHYYLTIYEWLEKLKKDWYTIPDYEKDYILTEINNWIRRTMKWYNTYQLDFNPINGMLTLSGFPRYDFIGYDIPIYEFPHKFKVNKPQLRWLLHKLGYNHAKCYFHPICHSIVMIELYKDKHEHTIIEMVPYDLSIDTAGIESTGNCNVLSEDTDDEKKFKKIKDYGIDEE